MLSLEIRTPGGEDRLVLVRDDVVIGRSTAADVTVPDPALSRRHARFSRTGDRWCLEDLGSRNGTYLNGERIVAPAPLTDGDTISLSSTVVVVHVGGSVASGSTAADSSASFHDATSLLRRVRDTPFGEDVDADEVRRVAERLRVINEVHEALSRTVAVTELLDLILDRVFVHLHPQAGAVFLLEQDRLVRAAARTAGGRQDDLPESRTLAAEVIGKLAGALVADVAGDARFAQSGSLLAVGARSLVAAPLLTPDDCLGMIVLSSEQAGRTFTRDDLALLVSLASAAALRIRNIQLAEQAMTQQRWEREVALARRIQEALLASEMPAPAGWELYGGNVPSRGVSGDYYQVLPRTDGGLVLLLADVSGKGIAASIVAAYLDALCSCLLEGQTSPGATLFRVSRLLSRRTPDERFATLFLGFLDPPSGRLRYASAGHEPALLMRASGDEEWLEPTGMPVGILDDATFGDRETVVGAGDLLVLYSDGLSEAVNADDEEFGRSRLAEVCRRHRECGAEALARAVEAATDGFVGGVPYGDDRTIVIVRRLVGPGPLPTARAEPLDSDHDPGQA